MDYRYEHFTLRQAWKEGWIAAWPTTGERLPDFDLPTTDGRRLRRADLVGRPTLLQIASVTCPVTASADPYLLELHERWGDQVRFVTLYVREAHPGARFPQPARMAEKIAHALALVDRDRIPWTVAVDDPEGSLHDALGRAPALVLALDPNARVLARVLWANDREGVEEALELVARAPRVQDRRATLRPALRSLSTARGTLREAGRGAGRDFLRASPPAWALAQVAGRLPLPGQTVRGLASVLLVALVLALGLTRLRRLPGILPSTG